MQETKQKEIRVFVFVASIDDVPFFSKLFTDHTEMKEFSAKHYGENKSHDTKIYTSTYFDLTDKSFISTLLAERDAEVRKLIEEFAPKKDYRSYGINRIGMTIDDHKRNFAKELLNKLDGK